MSNQSSATCTLSTDPVRELAAGGYQFKAVFNERGIIIISGAVQHNTARMPGIEYEHDHKGNALAAMIYNGKIEVRGHSGFTPERVRGILSRLALLPQLRPLIGFELTYKNKPLGILGAASATGP